MGFNFGDIGRELEGAFKDVLNPTEGIADILKSSEGIIGTLGGVAEKGIDKLGGIAEKGLSTIGGSFTSLINMLPLILIGGGAIFLLTKSK